MSRQTAARPARRLRGLLGGVRERTGSHDLFLLTAGVTFYAAMALVPSLVVTVRLLAAAVGPERVQQLGDAVGRALPAAHDTAGVVSELVSTAVHASWPAVAVALLPATVYGEGLRRGFARLGSRGPGGVPPVPGRAGAWRVRLLSLLVLLLAAAGLLAVLELAPFLVRRFGSGSLPQQALGVYVALTLDWLVIAPVLLYFYRVLGPVRPSWRASLWASYGTGAFVAGFVQGFVLFLAIPVDLGSPFGGFDAVGGAVAVCLWLWVFTALTVFGYALALELDDPAPPRGR
ncbi:YihY/virulence factor BrkB family protein [Kineococcus glutinatus]|uniref:YhjD/YihY/BrkB family envelope integrity protein n=1 Tax=Kineococcus glutinatus TaxID=1070872 RepID=A0ABP9H4R0_9ACTN